MTLPPLYALRAFTCAAQVGSFSHAAVLLNVTPGAISRHIRSLEVWYECELFVRAGPKVELSPAGRMLAVQLQEGFDCIERASAMFKQAKNILRLKAPSTITLRWLLKELKRGEEEFPLLNVQITSSWMDIDKVDFVREPFDCAILLGNGNFGANTESLLLFKEWLIPVCSPELTKEVLRDVSSCDLIHPSHDRRDWRRWLQGVESAPDIDLWQGKLLDTIEMGMSAAISGHGISIGDLLLSIESFHQGALDFPFHQAVCSGEGYYLVWPKGDSKTKEYMDFFHWLLSCVPGDIPSSISLIDKSSTLNTAQ